MTVSAPWYNMLSFSKGWKNRYVLVFINQTAFFDYECVIFIAMKKIKLDNNNFSVWKQNIFSLFVVKISEAAKKPPQK